MSKSQKFLKPKPRSKIGLIEPKKAKNNYPSKAKIKMSEIPFQTPNQL